MNTDERHLMDLLSLKDRVAHRDREHVVGSDQP